MASNTTKIILGFIALIVGISLIAPISENTNDLTNIVTISSEAMDISTVRNVTDPNDCNFSIKSDTALQITNSPSGWKSAGCPVTNFVMLNQTGGTATVTTDYTFFTGNGSLYLENTTQWMMANCTQTGNSTTVAYEYCGDDYVTQAWQRTILDLISGFIALALMATSVAIFYSVGKDAGLIKK